jgi:microcystin-dependent protein
MTTPTITLYPDTLPAKEQANAAFDTNVDNFMDWLTATNGPELQAMITYTQDVADNVLATALAGDLPALTGKAGDYIRANAAEDGGEFRTTAQVLSDIGGLAPDGDGSGLSGIVTTLAGAISAFAFTSVPTGWLECDGSTVSRTTYADLFSAIGTTFGAGNGSTTFAIPDLRGEFLRGWDNGRGIDASRAFGSAQGDAFKSHNHTIERFSSVGGSVSSRVASANSGQSSTQSTLNSGGNETRPRNIALMYCVKF